MRFKALVHVRLRGSVSDAAGNAVMNKHLLVERLIIKGGLKNHLFQIESVSISVLIIVVNLLVLTRSK